MSLDAGVDEFGGEADPTPIVELVNEGKVSEQRIDLAACRILRWQSELGLCENPCVDLAAAPQIVRSEKNQKRGYEAQLESIVLLTNDGILPLRQQKPRAYFSGIRHAEGHCEAGVVAENAGFDVAFVGSFREIGRRPFHVSPLNGGCVPEPVVSGLTRRRPGTQSVIPASSMAAPDPPRRTLSRGPA